jgi:hypothetical protein
MTARRIIAIVMAGAALSVLGAAPSAAAGPGRLAQRITSAEPARAVAATRAALARAGDGKVFRPALPGLALEARNRSGGRISLEELAAILRQAGVRPSKGASTERLQRLLGDLVRGARGHRRSRASFAPLMLDELVRRHRPSVDLTAAYEPSELRLTALELQLLVASVRLPIAPRRARHAQKNKLVAPCSDIRDAMSEMVPGAGRIAEKQLQSQTEWLRDAIEDFAGDSISKVFRVNGGKALDGLGWMMQAATLAAWYHAVAPAVTLDRQAVRKPEPGEAEQVFLTVRLGMSDGELASWQQLWASESAIADCARALGFEIPTFGVERLREMKDWRLRFQVTERPAAARLVQWTRGFEGGPSPEADGRMTSLIFKTQMTGTYLSEMRLPFALLPESRAEHAGRVAKGTARFTAELLTEDAPNVVDFFGMATALPKFALGWLKTGMPPRSSTVLRGSWGHRPDCGEIEPPFAAAARSAQVETGDFHGTGRTAGDPDPEQERPGAECENFTISFTLGDKLVRDLEIRDVEWTCQTGPGREHVKRSPPSPITLLYEPQPDGTQKPQIPHRDGRFEQRRRFRARLYDAFSLIDVDFLVTGQVEGARASGTFRYSHTTIDKSASCSTGTVRWTATSRPSP